MKLLKQTPVSMNRKNLSLLIKVGQKDHIENLYKKGEVYMNYLDFFKKEAKDQQRKDTSEGASSVDQVDWIKLEANGQSFEMARHGKPIKLISAQVREFDPNRSGNIYSMMALDPLFINQIGKIDERNTEFGDTALLILQPKIFLTKLKEAINAKGFKCGYDKVTYYDEKEYRGPLDVFHKPLRFAHQLEFRFFIPSLENKPLKFNLGSLESISMMIHSKNLLKLKAELVDKVA